MSWPLSQDYNEAIQEPRNSFGDSELKTGEAVANALGIPMPRSGNFADVYEVRCPNGSRWAVKCFTREVSGLRERYAEISKYLQQANLPFMVDFQYLEQGIRIAGRWYPILKMHWVEGFTLNEFVRQYADKPIMLESLLQIWVRMAVRLRESGIAHGDLQHGNILLVPDSMSSSLAVKLIDYDGMWVPALAKMPSGEVGHPCYQHPQRLAERMYNREVDRFPLLLVATALNCIKVGGRALWEKYDSGDNLLFREADLRAPVKSPLFYEMLKLGDGRSRRLVERTLDALKDRLESVPLLKEVLPELRVPPAPKPTVTLAKSKQTVVLERGGGNLPNWMDATPPTPLRPATEDIDAGFAGTDGSRSRRRQGSLPRWMWCVSGAGVALVMAGGIFALALQNQSMIPKDEIRTAQNAPDKLQEKSNTKEEQPDGDGQRKNDVVEPPPLAPVPPKPQDADDVPNVPAAKSGDGFILPLNDYDRTGGYRFVHFGKDGTRVVLLYFDHLHKQYFARVYDLATGQALTPPLKHDRIVRHASFSPDGRRIVTASEDKTTRLWDAATGKEATSPLQHAKTVFHASFSPDGQRVVTASFDQTAGVWDVATGKAITPPLKHGDLVGYASFSLDGKRVVTTSRNHTARLWDAATGQELKNVTIALAADPSAVTDGFVPLSNGKKTTSAPKGKPVDDPLVNSPSFITLERRRGNRIHNGSFERADKSPWHLVTYTRKGVAKVVNDQAKEGRRALFLCATEADDTRFVQKVAVKPNTIYLLSGWIKTKDVVIDQKDGAVAANLSIEGSPNSISMAGTKDWTYVYVTFNSGIRKELEVCARLGHYGSAAKGAVWFDDLVLIEIPDAEGSAENEVPTDAELRRFAGQGKPVREVLSPDGRWTLSWDGNDLRLCDARTGKELRRFRGHTVQESGPAFSTDGSPVAAFSPDGKQVLSGGWDKTVRLWDAATGEQLRVFEGHTSHVHAVAFSPDGKRAASAAGGFVQRDGRRVFVDCTVRLWDVATGRQLKTFEGHKEWVVCVAFSPDGRRLLSGSYDKTVRLWDVETGRELRQFQGHTAAVQKVRFSPSGRYILSASGVRNRTARVWDATNGRELKRIDLADAEGAAPAAPASKGCRSVHLFYAGDEGTAFYNEVTVNKSAPGTYFMVCGWDRGYYGIQEQDKGVKILLYSVWDNSKQNNADAVPADKRVKLNYRDRAVRVGRFGGEGTGGQSVFSYNWKAGQTYRFLVTAAEKDGRTEYAGYFYEPERKGWRHLVTFSAPQSDATLRGYYSFLEDFKQDGKSRLLPRQAHFGNGWIKVKGEWAKLAQARFTATDDPARNIGAGADPRFWLSTGGGVPEISAALNSDIKLPAEARHALPDDLPIK